MLASTIQFTTNPPTPTHNPQQQTRSPDRSGNQGALPQNPDSMPPPHTQGHPPPADHHGHNSPSSPPQRACFLHQAPDKPTPPARTNPRDTVDRPAFRESKPPAGPDPFNSLSKIKRPGSHPTQIQSLERR